jgi:hypothetical protein
MMVARVWQRAGLKPHRIERYMASDDPEFELKAADIIGLYVKPPQHAAVFCVDEKTAIQALDRLDILAQRSEALESGSSLSGTWAISKTFTCCPCGTIPITWPFGTSPCGGVSRRYVSVETL